MIGQHIGNYRIMRLVGQGGMGEVYEAVHEQIRRRAAVKVLNSRYSHDEEMTQRFFNEALAVNVIQHPSIVGVFESGRLPDGRAFIVMEYLDGISLRKRLEREGALPESEVLRLGRQVATALAVSHEKGIIHRDLKSDNVMLVDDEEVPGIKRVKILDFGIAKVAAEYQVNAVKTKDGIVMGTPEYMSPEQWMSSNVVDAKSDVYAMGALLYEMSAGRYPFIGENANQIMVQHLYEDARPLNEVMPTISAELSALVMSMLAKTRATRPTMSEVATHLEALLEGRKSAAASSGARSEAKTLVSLPYKAARPSDATVMAQGGALQQPIAQPLSDPRHEAKTQLSVEKMTPKPPAERRRQESRKGQPMNNGKSPMGIVIGLVLLMAIAGAAFWIFVSR